MFDIIVGIVVGIVVGFVILRLIDHGHLPDRLKFKRGWVLRDDTDSREENHVSGMSLFVDHGTGLQYIQGGMFGGMIPRLDKDGSHMSIEADE